MLAVDVARETDAEQTVDHAAPSSLARQLRRPLRRRDAEELSPAAARRRSAHRRRCCPGRRAPECPSPFARQRRGELRGRRAGALHQRRLGVAGGAFDAPDFLASGRSDHARGDCKGIRVATMASHARAFARCARCRARSATGAGVAGRDERPVARILMYPRHAAPRGGRARARAALAEVAASDSCLCARSPIRAERRHARAQVALTFDDGLRNNVEVAYPLLHRLGLPATFFVCPGLIGPRAVALDHEARRRPFAPAALRHAPSSRMVAARRPRSKHSSTG